MGSAAGLHTGKMFAAARMWSGGETRISLEALNGVGSAHKRARVHRNPFLSVHAETRLANPIYRAFQSGLSCAPNSDSYYDPDTDLAPRGERSILAFANSGTGPETWGPGDGRKYERKAVKAFNAGFAGHRGVDWRLIL